MQFFPVFTLVLSVGFTFSEPLSLGAVALGGVATAGFFGAFDFISCRFHECCREPWLKRYPDRELQNWLHHKLHGQHLAADVVTKAVRAHLGKKNPKKALVMSFHGWAGGGKNFVSKFVAEAIYQQGLQSQFAHLFVAGRDFAHNDHVAHYKTQLDGWIRGNVSECATSLFIFDEIDKMAMGVMDAIQPYLDFHETLSGVDYRKSIFVFLSNTGGKAINQYTLGRHVTGRRRESIELEDVEHVVRTAAFNEDGGLRYSQLIERHLIDHFVPFLPMEKKHVRLCIIDHWVSAGEPLSELTEPQIEKVLNSLEFWPNDLKIYSTTGCKRIHAKVDLLLEGVSDRREL